MPPPKTQFQGSTFSMRLFSYDDAGLSLFSKAVDDARSNISISPPLADALSSLFSKPYIQQWKISSNNASASFFLSYMKEADVKILQSLQEKIPGLGFDYHPSKKGFGYDLKINLTLSTQASAQMQKMLTMGMHPLSIGDLLAYVGMQKPPEQKREENVFLSPSSSMFTQATEEFVEKQPPIKITPYNFSTGSKDKAFISDNTQVAKRLGISEDGKVIDFNPMYASQGPGTTERIIITMMDVAFPVYAITNILNKYQNQEEVTLGDYSTLFLEVGLRAIGIGIVAKGAKLVGNAAKFFTKGEFWAKAALKLEKAGLSEAKYNAGVRKALREFATKPWKYSGKTIDEAAEIFANTAEKAGKAYKTRTITKIKNAIEIEAEIATKWQKFKSLALFGMSYGMASYTVGAIEQALDIHYSKEIPEWVFQDPKYSYVTTSYDGSPESIQRVKEAVYADLKRELALFWVGWKVIIGTGKLAEAIPKIRELYLSAFKAAEKGADAAQVQKIILEGSKTISNQPINPSNPFFTEYLKPISEAIASSASKVGNYATGISNSTKFEQTLALGLQGAVAVGYFGEHILDPFGTFKDFYGFDVPIKGINPELTELSHQQFSADINKPFFEQAVSQNLDVSVLDEGAQERAATPADITKAEREINTTVLIETNKNGEEVLIPLLTQFRDKVIIIDFNNEATYSQAEAEIYRRAKDGNISQEEAYKSFQQSYSRFYEAAKSAGFVAEEGQTIYDFSQVRRILYQHYDADEFTRLYSQYEKKGSLKFWLDVEKFSAYCLSANPSTLLEKNPVFANFISEWQKNVISAENFGERLQAAEEQTLKYLLLGYINREFYEFSQKNTLSQQSTFRKGG